MRWLGALALCAGCGSNMTPQPAVGGGGGDAGGGGGGVSTVTLEKQLEAALSGLSAPPFGPAAAASAAHANESASVALGVHHAGGPATSPATRFNVASVSKTLTAARVVSWASAGTLALGDPISTHLPGVTLRDAGGVDQSGNITIADLLRHRAGLPHFPADLEAQVAGQWQAPDLLTTITASWEITLTATPGTYQYSNLGYALLGAIVERTGGCVFAACMSDYLAELGMHSATFWPADLDPAEAAHGHVLADGVAMTHAPSWYGSRYAIPFTGLWTTMDDLAAFGRTLIDAAADPSAPLHPMTSGDGYGLGMVHGERFGAPTLEHDGSGPGFYAALVVFPSRDAVVAIATNGGNEQSSEVNAFGNAVSAAAQAVSGL